MPDPRVPETLDGWSVLHQMFRVRWTEWDALPESERTSRASETASILAAMQQGKEGTSAPVTLLGHKGDLLLLHYGPQPAERSRDIDAAPCSAH